MQDVSKKVKIVTNRKYDTCGKFSICHFLGGFSDKLLFCKIF